MDIWRQREWLDPCPEPGVQASPGGNSAEGRWSMVGGEAREVPGAPHQGTCKSIIRILGFTPRERGHCAFCADECAPSDWCFRKIKDHLAAETVSGDDGSQ